MNKDKFDVSKYPEGYEKVKEQFLSEKMSTEEKEKFMNALIGFLVKG